jgi:hypothetical protein
MPDRLNDSEFTDKQRQSVVGHDTFTRMKKKRGSFLKGVFGKAMFHIVRWFMCKPVYLMFAFLCQCKLAYFGKFAILVPADKFKRILEGVEYLRAIDPAMFSRLTTERKYLCCYNKTQKQNQEFFTITDKHLAWGKEGVVVGLIDAILEFDLVESPARQGLMAKHSQRLVARFQVENGLYLWLEKHSFHPSLVKRYQTWAEERKQALLQNNLEVPC